MGINIKTGAKFVIENRTDGTIVDKYGMVKIKAFEKSPMIFERLSEALDYMLIKGINTDFMAFDYA